MSNVARVAATAANTLEKPPNVEDVFSTYLYTGTSDAQSITNDIDLSNEGGLVWIKNRGSGYNHELYDTERGATKDLGSNQTDAEGTNSTGLTAFNSNGFTVGTSFPTGRNGEEYVSWTWRKAPKFFDCVTYTGSGVAGKTVSHNLGSVPGCIIVKRTDGTGNWSVYHRGNTAQPETDVLYLNLTNATSDVTTWNDTAPTSTEFQVSGLAVNTSGATYVAYLFAHNDGDGTFGPDGDADIIKCGSFTATAGTEVDLGFEPQFVITKSVTSTADWYMFDIMRGWGADQGSNDAWLIPNTSGAETNNTNSLGITPTGFTSFNGGDATYIYIAIRRPMAVPESATDVFGIETYTGNASTQEITTDMTDSPSFVGDAFFAKSRDFATDGVMTSRLTGQNGLYTSSTGAEGNEDIDFFNRNSVNLRYQSGNMNYNTKTYVGYLWSRSPNYFDVVAYSGNSTAGRTVSHNLGVAPEMIWVKARNVGSTHWTVYHSGMGNDTIVYLSSTTAPQTVPTAWNSTTPSSTDFTLGTLTTVNQSLYNYIAYLFTSLDGVSKVGSYTGNGSSQTIDCGFSAGARFVLIRRTDSTGDWYVWDTERGIVAANDPHLSLNTTAAEVTTDDSIDPVSSGFAVNQVAATNINVSSATYIYYAIA